MTEIMLFAIGICGYLILYQTWCIRQKMKRYPFLSENWKVYISGKKKYILYGAIFIISSLAIGHAIINFSRILTYFNAR